ncbi:hypothetical protein Fot_19815 [Forsythia ovata]|uniref:Uncharacterized protein n=1 Tax=Forsythia ovata TaxID=205694 RepID=A0ABD1VM30_9LAMI
MARAKNNHTQQHYNHKGHANAKSSDDNMRRQTGRRQRTHQRSFPGTGSSYAAEITEAIPNLHTGLHAPNQGMAAGQAGPNKSKKPFTNSYCPYHRFYGHSTEDCRDIQALVKQRTQKKDRASSGGNRDRNSSPFWSNELRRGRHQEARNSRSRREAESRKCGWSNDRENTQRTEVPKRDQPPPLAQQALIREIDTIIGGPHPGGSSNNSQKRYIRKASQM